MKWYDVSGQHAEWGFKYQVNRKGDVRNKFTGNLLATTDNKNGYLFVTFVHKGKRSWPSVHSLVANTLIKSRSGDHQVNHKDGVKTNNHVNNLEWVTAKRNTEHSMTTLRNYRHSIYSGNCKYPPETIHLVRNLYPYLTCKQISDVTGIPVSYVRKIGLNYTREQD